MEGRPILDASLIANEAIDLLLKSNDCGLIYKLGIEKAYNHVNWSFLLLVLKNMGFDEDKWINWRISFVSCSVLFVNSSAWIFFQSFEVWGKADTLPYLFVIVMEVLSCLFKRAKVDGFVLGWRVRGKGGEGVEVSHLLFVDDTSVFCEPS